MSTNGTKQNFFKAHYDWIALAVGVLALGYGVYVTAESYGQDPEAMAAASMRKFDRDPAAGTGVKAVDLADYRRAYGLMKKPPTLAPLPERGENFLAGECRVFCPWCKSAMPSKTADDGVPQTCPNCGKAPPEEIKVTTDADKDGLPYEWETKYGLNDKDASDAQGDLDGDGFTNAEEFAAGTNPIDRKSHPDYLDSLKIVPPLKETMLPFYFVSALKTPSGTKLDFLDPKKRNDYGQKGYHYYILEGEKIGKTGFTATKYEPLTKKVKIAGGGGAEKAVDASQVVIRRDADGKELQLGIGEKRKPVDVQVVLAYDRGKHQEFVQVAGDTIQLNLNQYKIKSIRKDGGKVLVDLENTADGAVRTLEALER